MKLAKLRRNGTPVRYRLAGIGSQRRLQALYAMGYGINVLSQTTGISKMELWRILTAKRKRIGLDHAQAIVQAYDRLSMSPAPSNSASTRVRRRAQEEGWAPPLAWDDIDNPRERPKGVRRQRAS